MLLVWKVSYPLFSSISSKGHNPCWLSKRYRCYATPELLIKENCGVFKEKDALQTGGLKVVAFATSLCSSAFKSYTETFCRIKQANLSTKKSITWSNIKPRKGFLWLVAIKSSVSIPCKSMKQGTARLVPARGEIHLWEHKDCPLQST